MSTAAREPKLATAADPLASFRLDGRVAIVSCVRRIASGRSLQRSGDEVSARPRATMLAPSAGIAGDKQAALLGQACLSAGAAKNAYLL